MTIQKVHEYLIAFRDAEHAAYRAMLFEPDFERFSQAKRALEQFAPGIRLGSKVMRWEDEDLPSREEGQKTLSSQYAPREILRIEQHSLPDGSVRYAGSLSATFTLPDADRPEPHTSVRFIIRESDTGYEIESRQRSPTLAFPYWETTGGPDIQLPDEPDEVVVYIEEE
jgi:hypothetical protein